MVISHTISLQFKPPAAARIRLLLHAAAHSCAGTAPDRMVRDGNKDKADTGIPAQHLAPIKKVERSKRRDVMALTASLGVITRGALRPPPSCPRSPGAEAKDSRAQMDRVKLSQTGIQSKLPEQWSCKGFTVGQLSQAFVSSVEKKKEKRKKDIKHVVVVGLKSHICF